MIISFFFFLFIAKKSGPNNYNEFIKEFKDYLIANARRDFWYLIVKGEEYSKLYQISFIELSFLYF